jgi:hypothetical protein
MAQVLSLVFIISLTSTKFIEARVQLDPSTPEHKSSPRFGGSLTDTKSPPEVPGRLRTYDRKNSPIPPKGELPLAQTCSSYKVCLSCLTAQLSNECVFHMTSEDGAGECKAKEETESIHASNSNVRIVDAPLKSSNLGQVFSANRVACNRAHACQGTTCRSCVKLKNCIFVPDTAPNGFCVSENCRLSEYSFNDNPALRNREGCRQFEKKFRHESNGDRKPRMKFTSFNPVGFPPPVIDVKRDDPSISDLSNDIEFEG